MGALLEQITVRTTLPAWVRKWQVWLLSDFLIIVLLGCSFCLPTTGLPMVDALIAYNNLVTGPLQLALVVLVSCDCNSFRLLFSLTEGSRKLAASMLKLSYTIYLTHWPWAICMHLAGLFSLDSWNSMLATWGTSVLFAIFLDFVVVDPFTAAFCGWITPPKPQGAKDAAQSQDAQNKKATKAPQDDLERGSAAAAPQVAAAPSERSERSSRRAESLPFAAFRFSQV
ncbi:PFP-BETA1 [Symbiodinium natans]|uniref:PFP-BETA1 protein n=1 Tax=Symbiodinium natans TaxID=878477 RepID=A0A812U004_9DINO|nr:PFP-BETA1 [Symbiodinium natans]